MAGERQIGPDAEEAVEICPWCDGSGWLCDGCGRPEVLCMASECRGAGLSMSGCPHCVIAELRREVARLCADLAQARAETVAEIVARLRVPELAGRSYGSNTIAADLIEREFGLDAENGETA